MSEERALQLVKQARLQLERERARHSEPIAIVGMACRLPGGVSSPSELWQLLMSERDTVSAIPRARWDSQAFYDPNPDSPGKSYVRHGHFIDGADQFEPEVFGISPREAATMDPQQRLLLETTWEALEDGGLAPDPTQALRASVWVATSFDDYARRSIHSGVRERIDGHAALGNARSVAAGRIAYAFGFTGPAVQMDTACSSSLVALHLACRSLRAGESDWAVVGAANVLCAPESMVALSKLRALSRDGRCRTFSSDADGYGRGEGCVVLLLRRHSDAIADHRRIHALVRGTAINHDGRSNGLTAPSGSAQEAVIRAALADGHVSGTAVDYVEAHGTGTLLGDPIEVEALSRVYGSARGPERPLRLGSIKTNIGHLESAAGVAGVLKVILALKHGVLPAHLACAQPNPRIPWAKLPLEIVHRAAPWPRTDEARIAGVSSFGMSGTNAHVLVQEAPAGPATPAEEEVRQGERTPTLTTAGGAELVVLSARTPEALCLTAVRLLQYLHAHPDASLYEIAHGLLRGRTLWPARRALVASSTRDLQQQLQVWVNGPAEAGFRLVSGARPSVVFVYPPCHHAWTTSLRELYDTESTVRQTIDEFEAALGERFGWCATTNRDSFVAGERTFPSVLDHVVGQVALARTWQAWGVVPTSHRGSGMGEIAAAFIAGVLDLDSLVDVLGCLQGLLQQAHASASGVSSGAAEPDESAGALLEHDVWGTVRWAVARTPVGSASNAGDGEESVQAWLRRLLAVEHGGDATPGIALDHSIALKLSAASVNSGQSARSALLTSAARLFEQGVRLQPDGVFPLPRRAFDLPTYAWQKKRYWLEMSHDPATQIGSKPGDESDEARVPIEGLPVTAPDVPRSLSRSRQAAFEDPQVVASLVRQSVARVLEIDSPESVALDVALGNIGLDSVTGLELRALLEETFETPIPPEAVDLDATPANLVSCLVQTRSASEGPHQRVVNFECKRPIAAPSCRVYCFHDAGGAADLFRDLADLEAVGCEVHTVSSSRLAPPSAESASEYLEAVVDYIRQRANLPTVLLGHSLGALLAWRIALALEETTPPLLCVLSAPPQQAWTFEAVFEHLSATKESRVVERLFTADVALYHALPPARHDVTSSSLAVVVGRDDHLVREESARNWRDRTTADFSLAIVPGDHFYPRNLRYRRLLEQEVVTRVLFATRFGRGAGHEHRPSKLSRQPESPAPERVTRVTRYE